MLTKNILLYSNILPFLAYKNRIVVDVLEDEFNCHP